MCLNCSTLIKAIDAYIQKADGNLSDALGAEGYAKPKKTLKYIQEIEDGAAEALFDETNYILEEAEKAADLEAFAKDIWPKVKLSDGVGSKLATVFTESLEKFMPEFIDYYIQQTDKDLKLAQTSKRTTAWVKSWSQDLGEIMKLNSHTEIEHILTKGLEEGSGIAEFTRAILESGIRDEYYKARRVAVTEVLTAHRAAQQEAFMQSPAVSEKAWKHTGEYRNDPRQNHVDMDGQRVPVDDPFELTGADGVTYYPMYPGDPVLPAGERINCHCIQQPVVNEEILGLSLEERQRLQQQAIDEMDDEWEKELDAKNKAKAGIEETVEEIEKTFHYDIIKWDEEAHPRDENGRFTSGGADSSDGGEDLPKDSSGRSHSRTTLYLPKKEYAKVMSAINDVYETQYKDKKVGMLFMANDDSYNVYCFEIYDFNEYNIYDKEEI